MSVINWEKAEFNKNYMLAKRADKEDRKSKIITDEEAVEACYANLEHPVMIRVREMLEEAIENDNSFSVYDAVVVIKSKDRKFYYDYDYNWDHNGDALVGQFLKEEYPEAKMKLNVMPKGFKIILEKYPDSFTQARKRIAEAVEAEEAKDKGKSALEELVKLFGRKNVIVQDT